MVFQNFITKLSDSEKKVFYVMMVFVFLALFDRLFLSQVLNRLAVIDEEIDREKTTIVRDMRIVSYKDKIQKDNIVFDKYVSKTVKDDDVVNAEFLRALERISSQNKVTLVKSTPTQPKKDKKIVKYYANVDCSGAFENIIRFMHALNSSDELFKVVKMNLTPKRGGADTVTVSLTVLKLVVPEQMPEI